MDRSYMPPLIFEKSIFETLNYPIRIMDQFFGELVLDEDLLRPCVIEGTGDYWWPRTLEHIESSGYSEVYETHETEGGELRIRLQTSQFRPEEVQVKVKGHYVVVHGKHEERPSDGESTVAREFRRKYDLPRDIEPGNVRAAWESRGVLVITGPIKKPEPVQKEYLNHAPFKDVLHETAWQAEGQSYDRDKYTRMSKMMAKKPVAKKPVAKKPVAKKPVADGAVARGADAAVARGADAERAAAADAAYKAIMDAEYKIAAIPDPMPPLRLFADDEY